MMGLLGLRRKPWKDADPKKRLEGVQDIPRTEQSTLYNLASQDSDKAVRQAAARRLKSVSFLERLLSTSDEDVVKIAKERLAGVAVAEIKQRSFDQAKTLLDEVCEQSSLTEIVLQASDASVRKAAFERLCALEEPSPSLLARIAIQIEEEEQALRACSLVTKRQQLKDVAKKAKLEAVQQAAQSALDKIQAEAKKPSLEKQRRARRKELKSVLEKLQPLTAISQVDDAPERRADLSKQWEAVLGSYEDLKIDDKTQSLIDDFDRMLGRVDKRVQEIEAEEKRIAEETAALTACCEKWEERRKELDDHVDQATLDNLSDAAHAEWTSLPGHEGRFSKRFAAIFTTSYNGPVAEDAEEGPVGDPLVDNLSDEERAKVEAILKEAETLVEAEDWREADYRYKELHKEWSTITVDLAFEHPLRKGFHDAYVAFENRCYQRREERRQLQEENLKKLEVILVEAEELAKIDPQEQEEIRAHFDALKDIQDRWSACKPVPFKEAGALRRQFRKLCDQAYEPLRKHREEEDWRNFGNLKVAEELIERAQALSEAEPTEETLTAIKELQQEWKSMGRLPRERHEDLWQEFKKAGDVVFEQLAPLFEERDRLRMVNFDAKEELIVELQAVCDADKSSKRGPEGKEERRARADRVKEIQQAWKDAGPSPRDKDQEQWQRFKAVLDSFYGNRRKEFEHIAEEQVEHYHQKLALLAEADELAQQAEAWKAGTDTSVDAPALLREVKDLQGNWKLIGHIPKDKVQETWEKFRGHCDRVYQALSEWFESMDKERQENLKLKLALLDKIEAFTKEDNPNYFREEVKTIQAEWREIGHIPREQLDDVMSRYQEFCNIIFNVETAAPVVEAIDAEEPASASDEAGSVEPSVEELVETAVVEPAPADEEVADATDEERPES